MLAADGKWYATPETITARELEWYRKHGRHKERIVTNRGGTYVEGDWSWNSRNPHKLESVNELMRQDGCYRDCI